MAWAPGPHSLKLVLGTSRGGVLLMDAVLHSTEVGPVPPHHPFELLISYGIVRRLKGHCAAVVCTLRSPSLFASVRCVQP